MAVYNSKNRVRSVGFDHLAYFPDVAGNRTNVQQTNERV
jgi:hypothetical protein